MECKEQHRYIYPNVRILHGSYTIVPQKRCTHKCDLRQFANEVNLVCTTCQSSVNFCGVCEKVFAISTLEKYGGVCGRCNKKFQQETPDDYDMDTIQDENSWIIDDVDTQYMDEEWCPGDD